MQFRFLFAGVSTLIRRVFSKGQDLVYLRYSLIYCAVFCFSNLSLKFPHVSIYLMFLHTDTSALPAAAAEEEARVHPATPTLTPTTTTPPRRQSWGTHATTWVKRALCDIIKILQKKCMPFAHEQEYGNGGGGGAGEEYQLSPLRTSEYRGKFLPI